MYRPSNYKYKVKKRRLRKKKSILKNKFFWIFALVLIAFISLFYLICFCSYFQIKNIKISGNYKVSAENIRKVIEENIPKKILFFNSKSIFLINLNKVEEGLLEKFPHVENIFFDKDFPDKLIIEIKEREPVAVFEKDNRYFLIAKDGVIFEETGEKESWLVVKNPAVSEIELGKEVIERERIEKIIIIETGLEALDIQTIEAEIVNDQRVNVKTSEDWQAFFNFDNDVSNQVFNLGVVLKEKISPGKRRNLEYVDLRFGNQVYYK